MYPKGRDSSVGIATHYGLDGPRIESRWGGQYFPHYPDRPWCPPSLLYNGYRVFPGGKAAKQWRWPPNPSSAEVKEKSRAIPLLPLWAVRPQCLYFPYRPWGTSSLLYNGYRVFPRGKEAEAWRWPLTPSSAQVKERVELYLYSPSGPSSLF